MNNFETKLDEVLKDYLIIPKKDFARIPKDKQNEIFKALIGLHANPKKKPAIRVAILTTDPNCKKKPEEPKREEQKKEEPKEVKKEKEDKK